MKKIVQEKVTFQLPPGTTARVRKAAKAELIPSAQYMRRAILKALEGVK